jgi:hypothetical protein
MTNEQIILKLQRLLNTHNPCGISISDGQAHCLAGKPCCSGCQYLTSKGCGVFSPACKFYFCRKAWRSMSKFLHLRIRNLGKQYRGLLYQRHDDTLPPLVNPPFIWDHSFDTPKRNDPYYAFYLKA